MSKQDRFNPIGDEPSVDELEGKVNLEKNDFLALVIAAATVFIPIALLFFGIIAIIVLLLF